MKLTKAQERAKAKLTREWQSAYAVGESLPTMEGLVARKVAEKRILGFAERMTFSPRTTIEFRLL